jgi:hypothetical protein
MFAKHDRSQNHGATTSIMLSYRFKPLFFSLCDAKGLGSRVLDGFGYDTSTTFTRLSVGSFKVHAFRAYILPTCVSPLSNGCVQKLSGTVVARPFLLDSTSDHHQEQSRAEAPTQTFVTLRDRDGGIKLWGTG